MVTPIPSTPLKASPTALPVSPEVATSTLSRLPRSRIRLMSRAIIRAAKSLKEAVGPRSSRMIYRRPLTRSRGTSKL